MMQTYSKNDLVRFLYHETSKDEDMAIAFQLEDDGNYNSLFKDLIEAKRLLDSIKFQPEENTIEHIVRLSKEDSSVV